MTTDDELSGLLNWVLTRTVEIAKTGAIRKRNAEAMAKEYDRQSHSLRSFLEEYCDYEENGDPLSDIDSNEVYTAYEKYCTIINGAKASKIAFGMQVKRLCDNQSAYRGKDKFGNKTSVHKGFRFDSNRFDDDIDRQSKPVQTCPNLKQDKSLSSPNLPNLERNIDSCITREGSIVPIEKEVTPPKTQVWPPIDSVKNEMLMVEKMRYIIVKADLYGSPLASERIGKLNLRKILKKP